MVDTLLGKTTRVGRMVTFAAVAVSAALFLVWCAAVIAHLYLLRSYYARAG